VPPAIITLTTDFGARDHYVGVMKGVIASINAGAKIIDICHEVRPCSVMQGAFFIAQTYRYFPQETVHVVVVDPGVGSARREILVEAAGQRFVAPDNGVLSQVYERESHTVRAIRTERFALQPASHTFHGRDIFAPVGAWLSSGKESAEFGDLITDYVRLEATAPLLLKPGHWQGRILNIDTFGNVVTSFPASLLTEAGGGTRVKAGRMQAEHVRTTYAEASSGEPFAIAGSSGYVEISIREASAAEAAGVDIGDRVELAFDA
jgi:S-adenosylmethionine hydrolase